MPTIDRGSDGDINGAGPLTVHFAMDCMALWEAIIDFCDSRLSHRLRLNHRLRKRLEEDPRELQELVVHLAVDARKVYPLWRHWHDDKSWDTGFCPWFLERCVNFDTMKLKNLYRNLVIDADVNSKLAQTRGTNNG